MDKFFEKALNNPGKTMGCVMLINIGLFFGGVAAIAVAVRYALTGHIG